MYICKYFCSHNHYHLGKVFDSRCQNLSNTHEANSTSCTTSHQHNTSTTTGLSPTNTPSQPPSITVKDVGNDTTSHPSTGSPNSMHSSSTSPSPTFTTTLNNTTMGPTKCQYILTDSENEAEVIVKIINGSSYTTYRLRLMNNQNNTLFEEKGPSPFKIPFKSLKPCTDYTVTVDECQLTENLIHFNVSKSTSHSAELEGEKKVCFKDSKWNLSKCVDITDNTSCVQKAIGIELDKCNYTMNVDMPPVKPEINFTETIPTQFEWHNKPRNCQGNNFKVHCSGNAGKSEQHNLKKDVFLVPSEMYNCTGKYELNNTVVQSNHRLINVNCDFDNTTELSVLAYNSAEILWTLSSKNKCSIIEFTFSGICDSSEAPSVKVKDCSRRDSTGKGSCTFEVLAFTSYTCVITAKYNYLIYTISYPIKTPSHKPKFVKSDVTVWETSHNSFYVNCKNLSANDWNGKKGNYTANLINKGTIEKNLTNKDCSFSFENLYYHTEYNIEITAMNGNGNTSPVTIISSTTYNDKAVIGFLVFLILVTSLALLFVLYKMFLLKRKRSAEDEEIPLTPEPLRRVEPIYAEGLVDAYLSKIADESRLFMDEFQSIPRIFSNYTIKEAKKQENQSKNRYVDILPYDYNRVILSAGGEDNYINASFIEGYQEPKKYIAAQGPKDETVCDFWQMVWEQKSSIIVMVTRCEEGNKIKCAQYWPSLDRETEIFDDFVVKIRSEQHCPDYTIRHLILNNKREKASEREVTHIQFISWPDHGVPGDPCLLLKLRRRVNSFKNFFSGPVVVHCSAGVGRTGTYIGIDAMIESLEAEGRVDIYGYVAKLRRQRCLMVQVEAQYILIHTALIEHNQFGETEVSLSEFHSALNTLRQKDGSDPSLLEMEFQKLPKFKKWRTFNTGSSEDNKKKNRYSDVIPYDFNRVLFRLDIEGNQTSDPEDEDEYSSDEEEESNEYINASFIAGYWCHKSLIAAQGPLPNTTAEFLLMLYQQQTKTLVMLTDCQEDGNDYCYQYWGDEKKTFGDMEIEVKKTESFPMYVRRRLEIQSTKKTDILEVDQYQFLKWKGRELPENAQELIEMIRVIRENGNYDNSRMNRNIPMVVHCNNGSSRTGIFCALWNLLDSAYTEKLVDVFHVVKNLRKERQRIVETIEQYQFLYTALEGAFPVENGAVKTPPANDTTQVINETTALLDEPNSTSGADQKEAEESKAAESSEQEAKESSTAEAPPAEGEKPSTTNGPAATVEL
ncbi:receptor-type tyrosine-protein phosphatase C-like isoform X2 [Sinocyclocheilus anshuiensis]|uniref:receptor-type tyrosine-protein phosphatase C-like isoform X2 n=2 Tax=Sinocyclocheilus anshuiensis TaxID=1608454 RepID=UPI0007B9D274|nr:PREDICTED: receptor-type tyrosine-protein phosphatase C-like isoform X2 [Sinocyclocheilus anshuiensis]